MTTLKSLGAALWGRLRDHWKDFAWGVFQGVIGALIGLLFVTLYLRGR